MGRREQACGRGGGGQAFHAEGAAGGGGGGRGGGKGRRRAFCARASWLAPSERRRLISRNLTFSAEKPPDLNRRERAPAIATPAPVASALAALVPSSKRGTAAVAALRLGAKSSPGVAPCDE